METLHFQGLGTEWAILVDAPVFSPEARAAVLDFTHDFEARFSRFLPDSEVNAFREAMPGRYFVSEELARLLARAEQLRLLTDGHYDPAVAGLLERAGYGMSSAVTEKEKLGSAEQYVLPHWSIVGTELEIGGPLVFDLGGMGKGYCIDRIGDLLRQWGHDHFLVDGGGDMFGTWKRDGSPWQVAIELPGHPDRVAGELELTDQGLAVSDRFRRRFGKWHHVVDPATKRSIESIFGCAALAPSAWAADCMTSGLFLASAEAYSRLATALQAEYLVFLPSGQAIRSPHWPGRLFT